MKKKQDVYVTRDSQGEGVFVFPATVGIRKFHGCVAWGAAWCKTDDRTALSAGLNAKEAECLGTSKCKKRFGFFPRPGTAWLVEYTAKGRMKKSKVDLAFSP